MSRTGLRVRPHHRSAPEVTRWAVIAVLVSGAVTPTRAYTWGIADSMAKFRADATPPPLPHQAALSAAADEFEPFQIVLTGPATNVTATASDLTGPGGTIPSTDLWLYREDLIDIPSDQLSSATPDDVPGYWPDPLVPAVDPIYGEPRNAFPFSVVAGETRAIWVDVFVPPGTPHGDYTGTVELTFEEAGTITLPVTLHVWAFSLPSTSSMRTSFGLAYGDIPKGHGLSTGTSFSDIFHAYAVLALNHRISISTYDDGNAFPSHIDQTYGDLLRGTAATRLPGARLTSLRTMLSTRLGTTYEDWWSYFAPLGFGSTLFAYACDEPPYGNPWSTCHERAVAAHAVDPGYRTLVTTDIEHAQQQVADGGFQLSDVNLMVPTITTLSSGDPYRAFLASNPSNQLWVYESCVTHGCTGAKTEPWPTYMIDADPVRNRALEWLSFEYGVRGELYFDIGYMLWAGDPWTSTWAFTGNGAGTLVYPGVPDTADRSTAPGTPSIGGTHDIPIPSIRLDLIREGIEDYEYLLLDQSLGGDAMDFASEIFPDPQDLPTSAQLMAQRAAIARDIEFREGISDGRLTLTASPSEVSSTVGRPATTLVSVSEDGGQTDTIALTASGLPEGASALFDPQTVSLSPTAPSASSTLTLAGAPDAGTYWVSVRGTDPSGARSGVAAVRWSVSPAPDFTLAAAPSKLETDVGTMTTSQIDVAARNGFAGTVDLTASGVPLGALATFDPTSLRDGGQSTLTLSAGTADAGTYAVTVTGTSGPLVHSTEIAWTLSAPAGTSNLLFSDEFDRATGMGRDWNVPYGRFTTDGTYATSSADPESGNWGFVSRALGTDDYRVVSTLIVPSGSSYSGVLARGGGTFARDLYAAQISTDGAIYLYRRNDWSWTPLAVAEAGILPGVPYTLALEVTGSAPVHLEVWLDGTPYLSYDDTSSHRLRTGLPGIENYDPDVKYDAFAVYGTDATSGGVPDAGSVNVPDAGSGGVPDAGSGSVPDAGSGGVPDAGSGNVPDAGSGGAPDAGSGGAPDAGSGNAPDAGSGSVPDAGSSSVPDAGSGGAPDAGAGALFFDEFTRTTGLGPDWTVLYGGFSTDGAAAVSGTSPSPGNWASLGAPLETDDYAVEADLTIPPGSLYSGVVARQRSASSTGDLYAAQLSTDGSIDLYRRNAWTWTRLGRQAAGILPGVEHALRLVVKGSSPVHLEVWLDGTERIAYDDSSSQRITRGGVGLENYDRDVRYDTFAVRALGTAPDFALRASPSSVDGGTGTSESTTLTVVPRDGFSDAVDLAVSGLPPGATASFDRARLEGSGDAILTLNAGTAVAGSYVLTVTGTSGARVHSIPVSWTLSKPTGTPSPLFSDDFNRSTGMGGNWSVRYGHFTTDGTHAVSGTPPSAGNWASLVPSLGTEDYSVEAMLTVPTGALYSGLVARNRAATDFRDLYAAQISTGGTVRLYRRNDWSWTLLDGEADRISPGVPYTLRLKVTGSAPVHLEVWLDGVKVISYDDSSSQRVTQGGPGLENYDSNVEYDAFTVYPP